MHVPPLSRAVRSLCLAALLCALCPPSLVAQNVLPTVTRTYALEDARVVPAPGEAIERATVIVRDGLIEAVGEDLAVPFDARRIAADSLTVYAGFISGLSHAAVDTPKENEEEVDDPGNPPPDRAGLQPDRQARAMLDPSDDRVEALRAVGFTAAHVVPEGRMLPGAGAIVQLAGDDPHAMVLRDDASLFAQFEGARRVYPATPMAVIATWRQLYREAGRRKTLEARYTDDPRGVERPPSDPVHSAFFPVIDGTKPVFFHTEGALEMHRALALHEELGFPLALTGLREGFRSPSALRAADADLFLSLALPEDTAEADENEPASASSREAFLSDFRTRSSHDTDAEAKNLKARQALARETHYRNAATLHEAGVRFGFATLDVQPKDLRKNLRTMVDFGLPEEAALAALTTRPAAMLGLAQQLGTVDAGKIANLVVTNGPYFADDTAVRYVFVDGALFEVETPPAPDDEDETDVINPAGTWDYTISTPQGEFSGTFEIAGPPDALEGTIESEFSEGETELERIELDGARLSFAFDAGQPGYISVTATLHGDEMEGTFEIPDFDTVPLSATRIADPSR